MRGAVLPRLQPHYVREYRRLLRTLRGRGLTDEEAFERAVGGAYDAQAAVQAKLVLRVAPKGPFRLIDVGCGSGRAAYGLKDVERLDYLGTDVVPELLEHARKKVARPDWRFELVTSLQIPAADSSADIVLCMSVFTHLRPAEVKTYIAEAARVLKPGGALICSYLERNESAHMSAFRPAWRRALARLFGRDVMISFTSRDELTGWLEAAGLTAERRASVGQHVLIARKGAPQ